MFTILKAFLKLCALPPLGGLLGSHWPAERFVDDIMIRHFIEGTFYETLTSEVVIKRRLNSIIITLFVTKRAPTKTNYQKWKNARVQKIYFLKGFCERMLTEMMGCQVKLEIQSGPDFKEVHKYEKVLAYPDL